MAPPQTGSDGTPPSPVGVPVAPPVEEALEAGPHSTHSGVTPASPPHKGILSSGGKQRGAFSAFTSGSGSSSSSRLHWGKNESKDAETGDGDGHETDSEHGDTPRHPPSMTVLSSVVSNVQSVIHDIEDRLHRMPKWQYRLLIGSIIFLLCSLVLMTVITVVYGFGMTFPHISITSVTPHLPFPFMDAKGAIPITGTMTFSNPNAFRASTAPTTLQIYALPERTPASLLTVAKTPGMEFRARQVHTLTSEFTIDAIGKAEGGPALVQAVAGGKSTLMYTTSFTKITVKSLGFLPISRTYRAECTILQEWSRGGRVLSDCWGRFV